MEWSQAIEHYGIIGGIAVFMVWQTWARETRMTNRVTELEEFVEERLLRVISDTTDVMRENTAAVAELAHALGERPCILDKSKQPSGEG